MRILWLGVGINEDIRNELINCGEAIMSAHVSESNLIRGLEHSCDEIVDTINSYRYPCYPKGPRVVKRREWSRTGKSKDVSVSYSNLKYFNHLSRKKMLKKEAKAWAKSIPAGEEVVVMVYSMHSPFMEAACSVKKIIKNAKIVLIVPDLPQYMDMNMSFVKKLFKKFDWLRIKKLMKKTDKYVLYSKHMADFLKLKDDSWIVMEGSYDASLMADEGIKKDDDKISIMYSGALNLRYGIVELLDAFDMLPENYELWLTGNGNAVSLINERAERDSRIKYLGYLPTRKDLLNKQREATMLISTRDPSEPASTYCFPSKMFEYMVSGNPVLSTRINGIPEEYYDYVVPLDSLDVDYLKKEIEKIGKMTKEQRSTIGSKAKEFVLYEKNCNAQMKKVIKFIKD